MTGDIAFNAWTFSVLQRPQMIVFTALLFVCLHLFLRGLTNNFWLSFLSSNYLIIIWLIATRLKIDSRREPILPAEAGMVKAYGDLLHMVPTGYLLLGGGLLLCLILGSIWLTKTKKISKLPLKSRVKWIVIPIIVIFSSCYWNHEGFMLKKTMRNIGNDPLFHHQLYAAQQNGAKNSLNKSKIISPNDFPAMVAEKLNAKISPYYALLTAVYQQIPAIYMGNDQTSEKGRVVDYVTENEQILTGKQLSAQEREILEDLRLIQYDITAGKNYVKETKFMQLP